MKLKIMQTEIKINAKMKLKIMQNEIKNNAN